MRNKSQKFKDRQSVFLNLRRFNKISAHEKLNKQIIMPDLLNEVRESEQTEKLIWRCYIIMVRFSIICFLKKILTSSLSYDDILHEYTYVPKYSKIANLAIN